MIDLENLFFGCCPPFFTVEMISHGFAEANPWLIVFYVVFFLSRYAESLKTTLKMTKHSDSLEAKYEKMSEDLVLFEAMVYLADL